MTRNKPTTCFAVTLMAVFPAWVLGGTLNVPGDFATIQACIDAAQDGDECVVAPATYHELIDFLGKAITLRSSGGPEVTIIDAGPVADPGTGKPVVRCDSGEDSDTVLDGFTITGGTGDTATFPGAHIGGGMFNLASSPTVTNCTFIQNTADTGGGMYNSGLGDGDDSSPTVTNCTFIENNSINVGGGMFNRGSNSNITLTSCTFTGNTATRGGGMYNTSASPTLTDCTFNGNSADKGGGLFNYGASPTVTDCVFSGNTAGSFDRVGEGGGMANIPGHYSESNPTVTNCTFTGNRALGDSARGGGMFNYDNSSPTLTSCAFSGNTAHSDGGGISNTVHSNPAVTNCILWGNSPDEVFNDSSTPTISFSDVQGSGGSDGWDASLSIDGGGNIDANPMFVRNHNAGLDGVGGTEDDDYGNLRLLPGSPCINAGDPGFAIGPTGTDLDGHARVLCKRVDMGAYEFGIGDFDCDQIVTLTDFANWDGCMTGPNARSISPGCEAFDFEFDGDVDLDDFALFQQQFTCPQ